VDQRLAELIRLRRVEDEPAQSFLPDLESIIRGALDARLLTNEPIRIGLCIGLCLLR
jgi:hypothetical protein